MTTVSVRANVRRWARWKASSIPLFCHVTSKSGSSRPPPAAETHEAFLNFFAAGIGRKERIEEGREGKEKETERERGRKKERAEEGEKA